MIIILSMISTFIPMSFYYIEDIYFFVPFLRIIRVFILTYMIMKYISNKVLSIRIVKLLVFSLALLVSTLLNEGTLTNYIDNISSIILISVIVDWYYSTRSTENGNHFLKCIFYYFYVLMFLNFVGMIIAPQGVYRVIYEKDMWHELSYPVYFLQTENRLISYILPLFTLTLMLYENKAIKKITFIIAIALSVITAFLTGSATTIVGIVVFILAAYILIKKGINKRPLVIICIVIFVFQIVFEFIMTQPWVLAAIIYVFGRIDTVLSRFNLGKQAIQMFQTQPLLGFGTADAGRYFTEGTIRYWVHNHSWDILMQGGLISYIFYIIYLIPDSIKKFNSLASKSDLIAFAAVIALLAMGNAESFIYAMEFYLIVAIINTKRK